jgi:Family of unknown function (DUF6247)
MRRRGIRAPLLPQQVECLHQRLPKIVLHLFRLGLDQQTSPDAVRAAMTEATETLDLTGVLRVLERWRRVAESSRDAATHRQMLQHADELTHGSASVTTEPWPVTKARLGL